MGRGQALILVYVMAYMVARIFWHAYLWVKETRAESGPGLRR